MINDLLNDKSTKLLIRVTKHLLGKRKSNILKLCKDLSHWLDKFVCKEYLIIG